MPAQTLSIDTDKIKKAVNNSVPLNILTYTMPRDIELYIEQVTESFLAELGQKRLKDYLSYCLRELAGNAKKANTKRVYFESRGLDINNPQDYEEGMKSFKKDTLENISWYLKKQKEKGYYIKVILQAKGGHILLEVRNNTEISQKEFIRIHDKLARSRKYSGMEEALSQVLDPSEGAGLGLIILVLMLKKIGLDEECFNIRSESGETVAKLTVPIAKARLDSVNQLTDELVKSISSLPQFPDNIVRIQHLIANPESQMSDIARGIFTDPALTADLLKLVNSAAYMMSKKVDNIVDAVKLVGIRGIRNLLYSYGTMQVLNSRGEQKKLWDHSSKTAYYAFNLARSYKSRTRALIDDAYVGGMLHDMGKIVFSSMHPDLLENIKGFCSTKDIPAGLFEDLAGGMNHAEVGARIAEKWNFPDTLVAAIRYHHEPDLAAAEYSDVASTVYLANMICEYQDETVGFSQINARVLDMFGIQNEKAFTALVEKMYAGFVSETRKHAREAAGR